MNMDEEFLLDGEFYDDGTEKMCAFIPTEPEEMKILEFNQFIRRINDPEQIAFTHIYLEIKKQFLASHKFNNARNKIKITNRYLYSRYLQRVAFITKMNKIHNSLRRLYW